MSAVLRPPTGKGKPPAKPSPAAANAAAASFAALTASLDYLEPADVEQVRRAYRFADEAHLGQIRASGEPYITHPIAVASQCAEWKLDAQALMAALLHDAIEDCGVTKPELCEDVIGAGVTYPKGQASTNKDCNFASQARYMDVSEPDLTSTFACAAKVGTGSTVDPERPMEAMVAAVASAGKSADCNLGFLRKDAILVVTFITDEDDSANDGSKGTVDGWKASLIAAKKGDETALVVLGLFGDGDKPDGICPPFDPDNSTGAEPSPRLRQFVDSFGERGVAGSVCADSYKDFFMEAVGIIDSTCDGFVPPPM